MNNERLAMQTPKNDITDNVQIAEAHNTAITFITHGVARIKSSSSPTASNPP